MSSTFGTVFKIATFGESHGPGVGVVIDGCPPSMSLSEGDIQPQLDRRRPGQSVLTTSRDEADEVAILSGVEKGTTLGTPIALLIKNRDQRSSDYRRFSNVPRPSHADYTYRVKYGISSASGGGRASARETVARVAAGAVAEKYLRDMFDIDIVAWVQAVESIECPIIDFSSITRNEVDKWTVRCPDGSAAEKMIRAIQQAKESGDSVGGIITCVCRNVPAGFGEPVFDKFEALLAQAMLSIPAAKGFDIGSGFAGTRLKGSLHNDPFVWRKDRLGTWTNFSGGIQGGISNGEPIYFRVAFKPTSTIGIPQDTVDYEGNPAVLEGVGRHDPCVLPRVVPVVESMAALVITDLAMRHRAQAR